MIAGDVWAYPSAEGRCAYCGAWCAARQWHHRRPSQKRGPRELGKCDLVCGSCHGKVHQLSDQARNRSGTVREQLEWIRSQEVRDLVAAAAQLVLIDRAGAELEVRHG